jgi:hypothetical protein
VDRKNRIASRNFDFGTSQPPSIFVMRVFANRPLMKIRMHNLDKDALQTKSFLFSHDDQICGNVL